MAKEKISEHEPVSVVFLGAGRPEKGESHPVLRETFSGSRVLDWLLQAYPKKINSKQFVGGYKLNELVKRYQDLNYVENKEWDSTGAVGSLLKAELPQKGALIVSYSDILYRSDTVQKVLAKAGNIVVGVDSNWKDRYQGRGEAGLKSCEKVHLAGDIVTRLGAELDPDMAEAEFIGLVCFKEPALAELRNALQKRPRQLEKENISALVEWLRLKGLQVKAVDVEGDWAELDDPRDLARFVLGTKAQTLDRLRGLVKKSRIEEQVAFTVEEWKQQRDLVIGQINALFGHSTLVVRSSVLGEDSFTTTQAGVYTSLLDIPAGNEKLLIEAVDKVAASYKDTNGANQILVQPMVKAVRASGVVFTRTLEHGAPYYVINYDDSTGSTASITGGVSLEQKMLVVRRDFRQDSARIPLFLKGLLPALREIEALVGYDALDVEFAVNDNNIVHIFQVRPITVDHAKWEISDNALFGLLAGAEKQLQRLQNISPFALGKEALFGIMPDWNPAEIIGTNPGLLAASLYQFLIMDEIWATQRAEYGYRDLRPMPLMVRFANRPYVDVRASFNSFIPAALNEELAKKLVEFYLEWLKKHPHLHDKVEFSVVPTCFSLDFDSWEERLAKEGGFAKAEIAKLRDALKEITIAAIKRNKDDLDRIGLLEKRFLQIQACQVTPLDRAYLLLHDCRGYGTLPFSHLARSAFVAVTLLKSAVSREIISEGAMDDYLNTLQTVGHEFARDAAKAALCEIDFSHFADRYGHLRPGTYDINQPSYGEDPERYLRPIIEQPLPAGKDEVPGGRRWQEEKASFFKAVAEAGICADAKKLAAFMSGAIEGREYAKFAFTRNLSAALDCLVAFGSEHGVKRADLAHISINDLFSLRSAGPPDGEGVEQWLLRRSEENRVLHGLGAAAELPPLLADESDFYVFSYPPNQANYIGGRAVRGRCVELDGNEGKRPDLVGAVALIPQADPGYDWLFGQGIAGLVTMYGGANSHMAIRAAEFGLPAAIGIGEVKYRKLAQAAVIELNAEKKWLKVIR